MTPSGEISLSPSTSKGCGSRYPEASASRIMSGSRIPHVSHLLERRTVWRVFALLAVVLLAGAELAFFFDLSPASAQERDLSFNIWVALNVARGSAQGPSSRDCGMPWCVAAVSRAL